MDSFKKFVPLIIVVVLAFGGLRVKKRMARSIDVERVRADAAVMVAAGSLKEIPESKPTPTPAKPDSSPPKPVPKVSWAVHETPAPGVKQAANEVVPPPAKGAGQAVTAAPQKSIIDHKKYQATIDQAKALFTVKPNSNRVPAAAKANGSSGLVAKQPAAGTRYYTWDARRRQWVPSQPQPKR